MTKFCALICSSSLAVKWLGALSWGAVLASPAAAQGLRLDPTFLPPQILRASSAGLVPGTVHAVVRQPDGQYVVGGSFSRINGTRARNLARLHADGTLDAAFTARSQANGPVQSLALQADGRIVAGGQFDSLAGEPRRAVGRLQASGALDAAFDAKLPPASPYPLVLGQVALLPGGDVLALFPGGPVYGAAPNGLYRLSGSTGRAVSGFQPAVTAQSLAVQPDGKIVTGGGGGSYILMHLLARLLPSGALDPDFTPLTTYFTSNTLRVQVANGSIYRLGAGNSNVGAGLQGPGLSVTNLERLNMSTFEVQPNGRVLVAGAAEAREPLTRRLLPDGQPDPSYDPAGGPRADATGQGAVGPIVVQPDGALVMGGSFTRAGNTAVHGLVRLLEASGLPTRNALAESGTTAWPVPAPQVLHVGLRAAARPQRVQLLDGLGRAVRTQAVAAGTAQLTLDVAALPAGVYVLHVHYAQARPVARRVVLGR